MILAIDQGTTGSRALVYDRRGKIRGSAYEEFRQYFPRPGWVEHDPDEILHSVTQVCDEALRKASIRSLAVDAIGITNQRETTLLWDRRSGKPVNRAIVWQDRRTAELCGEFRKKGLESLIRKKTGLILDPYFSGTKVKWLLENVPGLHRRALAGDVLFGTMDTWLLWNLTGKQVHATDATNASRTLLMNLKTKKWDDEILKAFGIPRGILPNIYPSIHLFGKTSRFGPLKAGIPIYAMAGDQQAALYGQGCYRAGEMKNTYGTGCFLVLNQGRRCRIPPAGLLGTIVCGMRGEPVYGLEGSIFIAGAAIQWLRDGLHWIKNAAETESVAKKLKDTGGVWVIPAFSGLGAPYWDPHARGAIFGLSRGTSREEIIKATLESIAYQTADVFTAMAQAAGRRPRFLRVDGGAARNSYLMQFQADLLGVPVYRSTQTESTAWGAAKLAGVGSGFWKSPKVVDRRRRYEKFLPRISPPERERRLKAWRGMVKKLLD